jgi:carbon monoxide dehydrogenase subunit G
MVQVTVRAKKSISIRASKSAVFELLKDVCRSGKMFPGVRSIEDKGEGKFLWVLEERKTLGKTFDGRYTTQHDNNGTDEVRWKTIDGNVKTGGVWRVGGTDNAVQLSVESEVTVDAPVPGFLKKPAELFAEHEQAGGIEKQLENIKRAVER